MIPLYLDNNNTLNSSQVNILNSLFRNRYNWIASKFTQKQLSDGVVSLAVSSYSYRLISLAAYEYYGLGWSSFVLNTANMTANSEYRLFQLKGTPIDNSLTWVGVVGNYGGSDASEYCNLYFSDGFCWLKVRKEFESSRALFTLNWRVEV